MQYSLAGGDEAAGPERLLAREGFIEDHTQRKDIGPSVRKIIQKNFRRHISRGSPYQVLQGGTVVSTGKMLGHSKIQDFHLLRGGQHNIFRLEIAVHNAAGMSHHQSIGALPGNVEKLLQREWAMKAFAQSLPVHVLHDQKNLAVIFQHVVNGRHVLTG